MQIKLTNSIYYLLGVFFWTSITFGQEIETSIFVTGNTGNSNDYTILQQLIADSKNVDNSTLLLVGNTVPKKGFQLSAEKGIAHQLTVLSDYDKHTVFIPGKNEWAKKGRKGVRELEKYIQKNSKSKFYPDKGCPIKKKDISDNVVLITLDSQWYLENWDHQIYLNEECDIKNRSLFFLEFTSLLKKAQDKIKVIAIHHPVFTNTKQGFFANVSGTSSQDFQNKQYRILRNKIITIARQQENVIFLSGKDENLQYINKYGIPQIISGASNTTKKSKKASEGDFVSTKNGYARLDIHKDGKAIVHFYSIDNKTKTTIFSATALQGIPEKIEYTFKPADSFSTLQSASVYADEETRKSKLYKGLWGDHYRKYYSKKVNAPVAFLDTLKGGLTPIRRGGGQQSKSLRMVDKDGKQYVMRALRKSALKFLQASAFQDKYIKEDLEDSYADRFLLDFYTTAHPYTPFSIGTLSDAVAIYHTNPKLYYIPKQERLGQYNDEFGDELYLVEERVESGHKNLASFGKPKKILSTDDVIKEVHKTGTASVDEPSYIRARIFDMLIGDWDRHPDQWRWALFEKEDGTEICKPIPRDRDQAFSVFDGSIISFLTCAIPGLRKMQSYDEKLPSPKWFNQTPYPLDMTFINTSDWSKWKEQAVYIQNNLTDDVIKTAFKKIPEEMKGETINDITEKLKGRRTNIVDIAHKYYKHLNSFEVITGTQKGDVFNIKRSPDGETTIEIRRKDIGVLHRTFNKKETKEIWLYGLDGKDIFNVDGKGDNLIDIKIIGGKKNDTYNFKNAKKVKLYDYQHKENTIVNKRSKKWLVDDYNTNTYDYKKRRYYVNQILPLIAFNPDDGLRIGVLNHYTYYGLQRNPFTQKHTISASFYAASRGVDVSYQGEFSHFFHNWNFGIEGIYKTPSFAQNFFGFGNDTAYDKDLVDLDFNRTRIQQWKTAVSLIWRGRDGGYFQFKPLIEAFEVENTSDRFINNISADNDVFDSQTYVGVEAKYHFNNTNDLAFPTLGFDASITIGYKSNIDGGTNKNRFGYIEPSISIDHKLNKRGNLVFATTFGGEAILGDDFEFYHGAQIGGIQKGLRGFRNERFTGKFSVYQNTDLRWKIGKFKTSFIPLKYGLTGGFDHGRVWVENDTSDTWHTSTGGSFWISGLDSFTANLGYYVSTDSGRITFALGFAF
ncbi:metallophosphatase [Aquimarina sp. RZ0]|uniref:metallophosphatase n=1 Tax=Aquimarina sp. RZ0 TaxID=2607730 RepID=UPI0011F306D8|nr:metallophosphatase [Aquimarina sp. RZ0]KAA1246804.1 metallophosphatase [Aquimarina sp. RZ0]